VAVAKWAHKKDGATCPKGVYAYSSQGRKSAADPAIIFEVLVYDYVQKE
jgi:hypothetical protein